MKVKVTSEFRDIHTGRLHTVGEVFEATEKRINEIMKYKGLIEVLTDPVETEEAPKKTRRRKQVTK